MAVHAVALVARARLGDRENADASALRAQPHRPPARRQRPHGAVQLAARARGTAARSSCASRTPTSSGRRASRSRASSRTCAGSASTGTKGPTSAAPHGPYRQSERLAPLPRRTRASCSSSGHAYYCFCSPEQLEADRRAALAAGRPPQYAGTLPRSAARGGAERASRLASVPRSCASACPQDRDGDVPAISCAATVQFETEVIGDPVLVRSDGHPAYNFAVVVDDALMEITHVIRGEDHISNTPRQVLLYEALRLRAAGLRAPRARARPRPHAAVEAPRRDVGRGVPAPRAICPRRS